MYTYTQNISRKIKTINVSSRAIWNNEASESQPWFQLRFFHRVDRSRHATENLTKNNRNEYSFSDTSWNVAEGCFIYLFIYQRERVYRLIHRDTFDRQKCQCTTPLEVILFRILRGVANLEIGGKWETAEVVVGPTGRLAACQIHRKRTGIVHDSISVSRPFRVLLLGQVKTGYFVCKSSNLSLRGCH